MGVRTRQYCTTTRQRYRSQEPPAGSQRARPVAGSRALLSEQAARAGSSRQPAANCSCGVRGMDAGEARPRTSEGERGARRQEDHHPSHHVLLQ